jgi:multiple sugar transport system ATP-binding protein
MILIGPSGSGKSTAVRWSPASRTSQRACSSSGTRSSNRRQPKDRDLAMVFQSYALCPLVIGACAGLAVRELAIGSLVLLPAVGDAYSQSASTGARPSFRHPNGDRRGEP